MSRLLLAVGVLLGLQSLGVAQQECESPMDIVLVIDGSGSIKFKGEENWGIIKEFAVDVAKAFMIGPQNTQIGLVLFSDKAESVFLLNRYTSRQQIMDEINVLRYPGEGMYDFSSLHSAKLNLVADRALYMLL